MSGGSYFSLQNLNELMDGLFDEERYLACDILISWFISLLFDEKNVFRVQRKDW